MTQTEINDLARALGMGPEACSWLWYSVWTACGMSSDVCYCSLSDYKSEQHTHLPDPEGDDPAVMLWDGALLRALGWPKVVPLPDGRAWISRDGLDCKNHKHETAALLAAWRATR